MRKSELVKGTEKRRFGLDEADRERSTGTGFCNFIDSNLSLSQTADDHRLHYLNKFKDSTQLNSNRLCFWCFSYARRSCLSISADAHVYVRVRVCARALPCRWLDHVPRNGETANPLSLIVSPVNGKKVPLGESPSQPSFNADPPGLIKMSADTSTLRNTGNL